MWIKYHNANFNAEAAAQKSEAEFIAHEIHNGLSEIQLSEVYQLCVEVVTPKPPVSDSEGSDE
jgi:hypothetical protein